jgi:hypothetical protein
MSTETITHCQNEVLVVTKCWCGVTHGVPQSLYDLQRRQFNEGGQVKSIYCPLGHGWIPSGTPKYKRLEQDLQRERASHDQQRARLHDQIEQEKNRTRAQKAAKTRLKNRVAAGVCPCCNRHFDNLGRHMAHQHPDFTERDDTSSPRAS